PAAATELEAAEAACLAAGATSVVRAADAQEADWLRQARRLALRALERLGTVRMEDVGVPRARVPELLVAIDEICARHGVGGAPLARRRPAGRPPWRTAGCPGRACPGGSSRSTRSAPATACGSRRSVTRATATSTRISSSTATIRGPRSWPSA